MATKNQFTLKKSSFTRVTRKGAAQCPTCRKTFQVGQEVVSKTSSRGAKVYHRECFEAFYID